MGQIFFVRHGQASFGSEDYDRLSDVGLEQSRLLGGWLSRCGRTIDHVVVGGMKRHRQTARACLAELSEEHRPKGEPVIDAGFDEFDANEVVVRCRPEFADQHAIARHLAQSAHPGRELQSIFSAAVDRWVAGENDEQYTESWTTFRTRCVAALGRITNGASSSRSVIVFTSGGPITAICQHVLNLPNHGVFELNWPLVNSGVTALRYGADRVSLHYLNNFAHLEQTGNAQLVTYR